MPEARSAEAVAREIVDGVLGLCYDALGRWAWRDEAVALVAAALTAHATRIVDAVTVEEVERVMWNIGPNRLEMAAAVLAFVRAGGGGAMTETPPCVNCIVKTVEIARLQASLDTVMTAYWRRRSLTAWRLRIERAALLAEVDEMRG